MFDTFDSGSKEGSLKGGLSRGSYNWLGQLSLTMDRCQSPVWHHKRPTVLNWVFLHTSFGEMWKIRNGERYSVFIFRAVRWQVRDASCLNILMKWILCNIWCKTQSVDWRFITWWVDRIRVLYVMIWRWCEVLIFSSRQMFPHKQFWFEPLGGDSIPHFPMMKIHHNADRGTTATYNSSHSLRRICVLKRHTYLEVLARQGHLKKKNDIIRN